MSKQIGTALRLLISIVASTAIVMFSKGAIFGNQSSLYDPGYCVQILVVVASIGFAVVAFTLPQLIELRKMPEFANKRDKLSSIMRELQENVVSLFIFLLAALVLGFVAGVDFPCIENMWTIKKLFISWIIVELYFLSTLAVADLVMASFVLMRIPIAINES